MNIIEETIDATLDANGKVQQSQPSQLQPGPVRLTIRSAACITHKRGLADVIREIAAEQRQRGYGGLSSAELRAYDEARGTEEDDVRDCERDAAHSLVPPGSP
jgi:hypothetical protein